MMPLEDQAKVVKAWVTVLSSPKHRQQLRMKGFVKVGHTSPLKAALYSSSVGSGMHKEIMYEIVTIATHCDEVYGVMMWHVYGAVGHLSEQYILLGPASDPENHWLWHQLIHMNYPGVTKHMYDWP